MNVIKTLSGTVLFVLLYVCLFAFTANATVIDGGSCSESGDVVWIYSDDGRLIIDGEGEMDSYSETSQAPYGKYFESKEVKTVVIGNSVTKIGDYAFYGCSAEEITIGTGVKYIGSCAFSAVENVECILLPQNVKLIGESAFACSSGLTVKVHGNNAYFLTDEYGVLYNYDKTELIFYPDKNTLTEYTVASTVKKIRDNAFCGAENLTDIFLSKALTEIGDGAFRNCKKLKALILYYGIEIIGYEAFEGCESLENIYYYASEEALSKVNLDGCGFRREDIICNYCKHESASERQAMSAACSSPGYTEAIYCADCCSFITEREIITVPHMDEELDKICDICGEEYAAAIDWDFCSDVLYDVFWVLYDNGTLYICGSGEMKSYRQYASPFYKYCTSIEKVMFGNEITSVGNNAFYNLTELKSIIASESIKSIGEGAFENAVSLNNIEGFTSLETVGDRAFKNCALSEFNFGTQLKNIGDEAFYGCDFQKVKLLSSVEKIGEKAFYSCTDLFDVTVGKNVCEIGDNAFGCCGALSQITVDSVNLVYCSVDGVLFNKAKTQLMRYPPCLTARIYNLPETVREISAGAFSGCQYIEQVVLNEGLIQIGDYAFSYCTSLYEIDIPYGTEKIGEGAFSYCSALERLTFSHTVNTIGDFAFCYCTSLKSVVLSESLTKIPVGLFYQCNLLETVTLGSLIEKIEKSAFSLCQNLKIVFYNSKADLTDKINICQTDNEYFLSAPKHFDGHTVDLFDSASPVCVYDGYTGGKYCQQCDFWLSGHEIIKAQYSEHSLSEYGEYKAATCTEKGENRAYCTRCDYYVSEITDAEEHEYNAVDIILPTCYSYGYTVCKCNCGVSYKDNYVDKLEHSFSAYYLISASTCSVNSKERADCINCSYYITRVLPLKNHNYSTVSVKKPTCTQKGYTLYSCLCGKSYKDNETDLIEHTRSMLICPSTTAAGGSKNEICTLCNKVFSSSVINKIASVRLSDTAYVYDGKVKKPKVTVKDSKGNKLVKGRDYTLKYQSGRKKTGKYTVTVTFKGNYSGTKVLTFKIIPPAVKKLSAKPSTKSVTLSWKKVKGATGYRIYYYNTKTKKYTVIKDTEKLSYTVTKIAGKTLKYGTDYKFAVKAYKQDGEVKIFSSKKKTVSAATKPDKATLRKASYSSDKINIRWAKMNCDGYELVYATNKSFSSAKVIYVKKPSKVKYTLGKIQKGATYYFKVRGYKTIGGEKVYGYYSTAKSVKAK